MMMPARSFLTTPFKEIIVSCGWSPLPHHYRGLASKCILIKRRFPWTLWFEWRIIDGKCRNIDTFTTLIWKWGFGTQKPLRKLSSLRPITQKWLDCFLAEHERQQAHKNHRADDLWPNEAQIHKFSVITGVRSNILVRRWTHESTESEKCESIAFVSQKKCFYRKFITQVVCDCYNYNY